LQLGQKIAQSEIDVFHILRRGLRFKPDEGVRKLRENTVRVAVVDVDIRAAKVAM
jgi:hypothetical protein